MKALLNVFRELNEIDLRNSRFGSKHDPIRLYTANGSVFVYLALIVLKSSASTTDAKETRQIATLRGASVITRKRLTEIVVRREPICLD